MRAVVGAVAFLLMVLIGAISASARQSADDNRRVLCVGILTNTANPARFDPRVIRLCEEVDIHPQAP